MCSDMLLRLKDIWKGFGTAGERVDVLRGVDLETAAGETVALTGESGSGKSTLLHLVAALDEPDRGEVWLDGVDLAGLDDPGRARVRRETLGVVFQQFNLIPSLDAARNVAFQARLAGRHDAADVDRLIGRLGLGPHRHKYPEQLSGGQQQRVAIGRALAGRPKLLLADEPTGNLDEETGAQVMDLMLELVAEVGAALLIVTHSERLAARADRRVHLEHGRVGTLTRASAAE
jgi:putative ABC transport system ATP-binding protein